MDGADPIASLTGALAAEIPGYRDGARHSAIVVVDSPRCPIDVDSSDGDFARRRNPPPAREIDMQLRALLAHLNRNPARQAKIKLSMFPTPPSRYFIECASDAACRPHLARLWSKMFQRRDETPRNRGDSSITGGAIFTRFMIAGFAVHRALRTVGIDAFEGYPFLGFRLWMRRGESLPPKNARRTGPETALGARQKILKRIARQFADFTITPPSTLDQADAAILAVTAMAASIERRAVYQIEVSAEGRFFIAFDRRDAKWLRDSRAAFARQNDHA